MTTDTPVPPTDHPARVDQLAAAVEPAAPAPMPVAPIPVSAPTEGKVWPKPVKGAAWARAIPQEPPPPPPGASGVTFTGSRWELAGLMLRGFLLMVPTLGIYRFWQQTDRRRFYWQNTVIAGEPLEYTGTAAQLLVGFLLALLLFVPIYVGLFVLSTQPLNIFWIGYGVVLSLLWFLGGYATYRGRDFRLSRTLWRGIRFNQKGSAWIYALRSFGWSLLMIVTLGLIFPWMAASLWRYRYRHTWYGDRNFTFEGKAGQLAGPYYLMYAINIVATGALFVLVAMGGGFAGDGSRISATIFLVLLLLLPFFLLTFGWFRCVEHTRMLSSVRLGDAALTMRVKFRHLLLQYVLNTLAVAGTFLAFGIVIVVIVIAVIAANKGADIADPQTVVRLFGSGTVSGIALIGIYLVMLATIALLSEIILAAGWWILLARGATVSNVESLNSVRSTPEDRALIGEGLADALNVGAY